MENLTSYALWKFALLMASLVVTGCATGSSGDRGAYPADAGTSGQIGGILLTENRNQQGAPKVIIASYQVTATGFIAKEAIVSFGSPGSLDGSADDYTVELVGRNGQTLLSYGVWDPRKSVVEKQGVVESPDGVLVARLPFKVDADKVRVRDKGGSVVAETEIKSLIMEFCRRLENDEDCKKVVVDRPK